MKELVKISETQIGNDVINSVDARELYEFLGSKQDFSTWMKNRIDQYGFIQDIDFIQFHNFVESNSKARIEYTLSLDMAKEFSMVEKTDKGKEARKYFIECERRLFNKKPDLTHFEKEMLALKYAGEILNLSDVSKLGMMQRLFDVKGFDKSALPAYVGKQRLSASASKLLEDRGKPMSTIAFNQLMVAAGLLEEKERKASHGSVKKFKALTSSGLVYGENLVSPKNDREVQPYYYEDSFDELIKIILEQE